MTTAALAREARCSKDTLYMLFEDRDAILAALVDRQASELNAALQHSGQSASPVEALTDVGTGLLTLLTFEASLAINRAALADPTGNLSRILIKRGKERSAPNKIVALIEALDEAGIITVTDTLDAYRTFYGLLIADWQILALHGAHEARGRGKPQAGWPKGQWQDSCGSTPPDRGAILDDLPMGCLAPISALDAAPEIPETGL